MYDNDDNVGTKKKLNKYFMLAFARKLRFCCQIFKRQQWMQQAKQLTLFN